MPGNNEINWCCPVYLCLKFFLCLARHFYVRSIIILVGTLLATVAWPQFGRWNPVSYYCLSMIICLVLTFIEKGFCDPKSSWLRKEAYMQKRYRELAAERAARQEVRRQDQQRSRHQWYLAPWLRTGGAIEIQEEERVLFHRAAENSESSNSASMSPAHQAASSDSGSNLPQTSIVPSMQPIRKIPVDNVTNEGPRNAEPSDSGSIVPQCSTDPSTQSTHSSTLDVLDGEPRSDESSQQAMPSDSGTTLPQSTHGTALDDVTEQ